MVIHQLVPSFKVGDATGQAALHYQLLIRQLGHYGEIFAEEIGTGLESLVRPARALSSEQADLVLYHHGIASPLAGTLLHLRSRRGIIYHNITPARFYQGTPLFEPLLSGRAQLAALANFTDLAVGDSEFNTAELRQVGYRNAHAIPLFVEPQRFRLEASDPSLLAKLSSNAPTLIFVSRVMPHKRFEDLLALQAELLRIQPDSRLLLVGEYPTGSSYFRKLSAAARAMRNVIFLGRVSHSQLVAAYRSASVFVSMSEHEGFGVPLLEAMASELPVIAFAAGAVTETLGGSGIAFTEKRYAFLAELVREVCENDQLRRRILRGQASRLRLLSRESVATRLGQALATVLPPRRPRGRRVGKPRVGFIVQRYGDVIGGSERLAQQLVAQLSKFWNITALTTCARDHLSWANEFPAGLQRKGPIQILRFPTVRTRNLPAFNSLSRRLYRQSNDRMNEERWIAEQGPACPGLFEYIGKHSDQYDGFVVFTYLYASAVWSLPMVASRALLVPTVHDEPPLKFDLFADVFQQPRALMCLTPEERELIERRFSKHARIRLTGVGVDFPPAAPDRFARKYHLSSPYLIYVGRLESGKGVQQLLGHYRALRRQNPAAPQLVLAGPSSMKLDGEGVHYLGLIGEQDKHDAIAGAQAVVIPSRFESLSLLALESFAQATPVVANAESEVLRGQVHRSGGGALYQDDASFIEGVERVLTSRRALGMKGLQFARKHRWPHVVQAYRKEMDIILKDRQ